MNIVKCVILCSALLLFTDNLFSQNKTDGWEEGSQYNKYFRFGKVDTVTGKILKIEKKSPLPGMAEGVELHVLSGKDTAIVQLCPCWMAENLQLNLKVNDEVEVEGCKAMCNEVNILMATKLVAPGIILQLRDEKGSPIWDRLR